uniref:Ig-like domain-containing protein n=1 Tax=Cyprinodon variegatus TaxID=28743 RepID=A0A3Q2CG22_CYPVA
FWVMVIITLFLSLLEDIKVNIIRITPIVTQQPNWSQMFRGETVTLRCEIHGGGGAQWTYEWIPSNSNSATSSEYRITAADSRNYRCRGRTGDKHHSIILVSPALPVTEGDPVTLSCRDKEQKLLSNVFFYHNNKLIHNDSREELKISAVSKSDEGFYKCEHSGKESPQSWMAVRGERMKTFNAVSILVFTFL